MSKVKTVDLVLTNKLANCIFVINTIIPEMAINSVPGYNNHVVEAVVNPISTKPTVSVIVILNAVYLKYKINLEKAYSDGI